MRTRLRDQPGSHASLAGQRLYPRLDAHVNGNGGGGSDNAGANSGVVDASTGAPVPVIFSTSTTSNAVNRDYAVPTYMALAASVPARTASVGYAGTVSDGLTQLASSHTLTPYSSAPGGHIVATEDVTPGPGGSVTLALGFGRTQAQSPHHHCRTSRGPVRHAGVRVGIQRRADRPGRFQRRSGAQLRPGAGPFHLRRLRAGRVLAYLLDQPLDRAEGPWTSSPPRDSPRPPNSISPPDRPSLSRSPCREHPGGIIRHFARR
jgi:hypothetical protein